MNADRKTPLTTGATVLARRRRVTALWLRRGVLEESFQHLCDYGVGRSECASLLVCRYRPGGPRYPRDAHGAGRLACGCEVDSAWVIQFFLELRRTRQKA